MARKVTRYIAIGLNNKAYADRLLASVMGNLKRLESFLLNGNYRGKNSCQNVVDDK